MYLMSGVPSFFVGPAGVAFAASLFSLYRISGVPSFLAGAAVLTAAALEGWVPLTAVFASLEVAVAAFFGVVFASCAKIMLVLKQTRNKREMIFFMVNQVCFLKG